MRYAQLFLSILLAGGLAPSAADATTVLPADFHEMVDGSHLIVHGIVSGVRSQVTRGRGSIESIVTVTVINPIKGAAAARIVFRVPNGQVGRYRRVTVGAPEFAEGDEVVLFLSGRPPAVPMPFGLNQGVYRVTRASGQGLVAPLVSERAGRIVRGDPARRPLTVDALARHVRAAMVRP